ncbi:MAG: hypothetical protein WEF86_01755 [Gemmatimonadota bacterium]
MNSHPGRLAAALLALVWLGCSDADAVGPCTGEVLALLPDRIAEASGIAVSRSQPGILWVHNDSEGSPQLYGLAEDGSVRAEIPIPAARRQSDWEDIAIGPCGDSHCLYIGDIGDNLHDRSDRAILRIREPGPGDTAAGQIERFPIRYPDRPRDAEAIFVLPDTSVYVISKGRRDGVTLYRYPPPLRPGVRVTLEAVQQLSTGVVQLDDAVTGAAAAVDGSIVAVRTYSSVQLYTFDADSLVPVWPGAGHRLDSLGEPQGEGVALGDNGILYLVSESGLTDEPAPLSRLRCPMP